MPLIDEQAVHTVEIEGDSYTLRRELGFYQKEQIKTAAFQFRFPEKWDGKDTAKVEAVPNSAEKMLARLRAYLVTWSHPELITDDTLKRLPPAHAEKILTEIEELEAAQPQPFRGQNGAKKPD